MSAFVEAVVERHQIGTMYRDQASQFQATHSNGEIGLSAPMDGESPILVELFTSLENSFLDQARQKAEVSAKAAAESLALATKCRQALDYSLSVITGYGLRLPQFDTTTPVIQRLTPQQTELVIVKPPTEIAGSVPGVVIDVATGWHRIDTKYRDKAIGYSEDGSTALIPTEPALPVDERGLVNLAKSGDQRAFTSLHEKYESAIFNYIYRTMGNRQDALDMTQDTFVKAYKALPKTSDDLKLGRWLYRIALNVCLDELRHRQLIQWKPWAAFISVFHPSQVAKDNPLRDVLDRENNEEVRLILEKMHPKYRMALILREYDDFSYDEIAEVLGTTRAAVKSLLFRAREEFRQVYAKAERKPGKVS